MKYLKKFERVQDINIYEPLRKYPNESYLYDLNELFSKEWVLDVII